MIYVYLNLFFISLLALMLIGLKPRKNIFSKSTILNILLTLLLLLSLTAIFDSLIIQSGIVAYDLQKILGFYIWKAPVEDFAYAFASALLTSLLWEYYEKTKK